MSGKLDDLITYIIVTCDAKTSVTASGRVRHRKYLQTTVKFILKVRGVNVIAST